MDSDRKINLDIRLEIFVPEYLAIPWDYGIYKSSKLSSRNEPIQLTLIYSGYSPFTLKSTLTIELYQ
jgi:hypothetical protein